jgi:hypothetical protein
LFHSVTFVYGYPPNLLTFLFLHAILFQSTMKNRIIALAVGMVLLLLFFSLLHSQPYERKFSYGDCEEVFFAIAHPSSLGTYEQWLRSLYESILHIIERRELNLGGNVYPSTYDYQDAYNEKIERIIYEGGDTTGIKPRIARYHLYVRYEEPFLHGKMKNVETCEYVMKERIRVEKKDFNEFNKTSISVRLFNQLRDNFKNITNRMIDELQFGKVAYYDYETKYHPVSPEMAAFTYEASSDSYFPGDEIEVTTFYRECDDIPIKNFDLFVDIWDGPTGVILADRKGNRGNSVRPLTDSEGKARFKIITDEKTRGDIDLEVYKESKCKGEDIVYEELTFYEKEETHWKGNYTIKGFRSVETETGGYTNRGTVKIDFTFTYYKVPKPVDFSLYNMRESYHFIIGKGTAHQTMTVTPHGECEIFNRDIRGSFPVKVLGNPSDEGGFDLQFFTTDDDKIIYSFYARFPPSGAGCEFHNVGFSAWDFSLEDGSYEGNSTYIKHAISDIDGDPYTLTIQRID